MQSTLASGNSARVEFRLLHGFLCRALTMAKRIGELLVESGAVSAADVSAALARQKTERKRLGELLVAAGKLEPTALAKALAAQFELPFVELKGISPDARMALPIEYQAEHRLVAFRLEKEGRVESIHVAVADPTKLDVIDELRFQMSRPIKVFVAAEPAVAAALEELREEGLEVIEGVEADDGEPDLPPEWSSESNDRPPAPNVPSGSLASPARGTDPSLTIDVEVEPWQARGTDPGFAIEVELTPGTAGAARPNGAASHGTDPSIVIDVDVEASGPIVGGAALADAFAPDPTPTKPARPIQPSLSEEERKLLESLERLARGQNPLVDSEKIQPARMAASLVRLLIKKGVIREMEFLDELARR